MEIQNISFFFTFLRLKQITAAPHSPIRCHKDPCPWPLMLAFLSLCSSDGPRFHLCLSPFFVAVMKYPMMKAPCRKKGLFRAYSSIGIGGHHHHVREHSSRQAWHRDGNCKLILTHRREAESTLAMAGRFRNLRVCPEVHLPQGHSQNPSHTVSPTGDHVFEPIRDTVTQSTALLCSFSSGIESGREVGCFTLHITRSH